MNNKRTIVRTCLECGKSFTASTSEVNRGNAHYCSLSCSAKSNGRHLSKELNYDHKCIHCGHEFKASTPYNKYCSDVCKQKHYRFRKRKAGLDNNNYKQLSSLPCEVCGWKESSRDLHHIIPVRKGGKDEFSNLISLCPNHHRMADRNLLSQGDLTKIATSRTISSPCKLQGQDA